MWDMTTAMDLHNARCQLMLNGGNLSNSEKTGASGTNSNQSPSSSGVSNTSTTPTNTTAIIAFQNLHMNRGILQV